MLHSRSSGASNLFHLTFLKYSIVPLPLCLCLPSILPLLSPMGLIKEYADSAVQTDNNTAHSPYSDPAVVLAAPVVNSHALAQEPHIGHHHSSSPNRSDSGHAVTQSPISPTFSPPVSRRLCKRKHPRYAADEILGRRIVSMPENKKESSPATSYIHGKRIVSMPDRIRPALEPSVELTHSPTTADDSFGSYNGCRERVQVPQTPSPPSSPESLLIIAAGTQLPEGFLRRKYSPEPLVEGDEDWILWANSPPRPIPALHGPLSLPYARCPSGAEGTIIEEPDNVAQMIWGTTVPLTKEEDICYPTGSQVVPGHRVPHTVNRAKPGNPRTQRQARDGRRSPTQVSPDIEIHQDIVGDPSWNEVRSMPTTVEVPDTLAHDTDTLAIDSNRVLEWQIARLRQALRFSLADMDSYGAFAGRLEPVIPAGVGPGFPQSYPRIFVEPRPNESISPTARQSPIEVTQQYRHQQLYRQALQKQKSQAQNILPTPPDSSSPQWSSHFSPYLTYSSTFSPELIGSTEHLVSAPLHKYRVGANASQYPRHVYDRYEHDNVNNFDTSTNLPPCEEPTKCAKR
ncbi:hypothetical protein JVU11DRAFT_2433 [Chiua virens]|nr:hypothetical protein JVU11DRAFT_2433 [Chiua virens]